MGYKQDIIRLRKQEKSYREIENELECSKGTIAYHCKQEGLEDIGLERNHEPISDEKQKKIDEYYKDHTAKKTAEKLDISETSVIKHSTIDKAKYQTPESIWNVSSRTRTKIIRRLMKNEDFGCCRCGWDKAHGDLHHIEGRDIENPHRHENLSYLCPNCHRLFHTGKIGEEDIETFEEQVGDTWKEYYLSVRKNKQGR